MADMDRTSLDAAWEHLQSALEMWEGELWRSNRITAGWALCHTTQARKLLEQGHDRLLMSDPSN